MLEDEQTRHFEEVLRDGISAAKNQQRQLAQSLLRRAIMLNRYDARPYLWLAATTDDREEKSDYLEQAVACDPSDITARQELALLTGKLVAHSIAPEDRLQAGEPQEASSIVFQCPQCGGHMTFAAKSGCLTCAYCGYSENNAAATRPAGEKSEEVLEFVMPTQKGHSWAEARHHLTCSQCGAIGLIEAGKRTNQCPYCGSNQLLESKESRELIDPHAVALFKVDEQEAIQQVKRWLGRGLFAPDDLTGSLSRLHLRAGYYSAWIFDGEVEVPWTCEVNIGTSRSPRWERRNGVEARFFDGVLVSGVRAVKDDELERVGPFDLKAAQAFKPEVLAGWPALIYDRSLSDASLLGREKVSKTIRRQLWALVEAGKEKRNLNTSSASWNAMTFKHLLLPLWVGTYSYRGKPYQLLLNGQTGKVGGRKPVDQVKVIFAILMAILLVTLLGLAVWFYQDNLIQIWHDIIGQ